MEDEFTQLWDNEDNFVETLSEADLEAMLEKTDPKAAAKAAKAIGKEGK